MNKFSYVKTTVRVCALMNIPFNTEIKTDLYTYYLRGGWMSKWTAEVECSLLLKGKTSVAAIPSNDLANLIGDAVSISKLP